MHSIPREKLTVFSKNDHCDCSHLPGWSNSVLGWRHNGGAEVQLHSFLTLTTKLRWAVNSMPWPLYPQGRIPIPSEYEAGWSHSLSEHFTEEKNRTSPLLGSTAACSVITVAHSVTQTAQGTKTSNQHTLQSVLYIVCCYANSPTWYMELFSIESVCLVDCISKLSFHSLIRKWIKELPNR